MKCKIQWVDMKTGKPTPDENEAVCLAVSTFKYPNEREPTRVSKFPCCAAHKRELDELTGRGEMIARDPSDYYHVLYTSQWTEEAL